MKRIATILLGLGLVIGISAVAWNLAFAGDEPTDDGNDEARAATPVISATATATPAEDVIAPTQPPVTFTPVVDLPVSGAVVADPATSGPSGPDTSVSSPPARDPGSSPPAGSVAPDQGGGANPQPGPGQALAPIDDAQILILESFPPQYSLKLLVGLPSGCAQPLGHTVTRDGDTVRVQVLNSMPEGAVVCTMIYGSYELNVPLGSDFESGREYVIEVNDKRLTLKAQ